MLSTAARLADIVGVNPNVGEGTVGREAIASMSADATERSSAGSATAAGDRFDDIEISILKFVTIVTDAPRRTSPGRSAARMGMDACHTCSPAPTRSSARPKQLADELIAQRDRWQGSYVTVQSDALESFAPVVAALAGT